MEAPDERSIDTERHRLAAPHRAEIGPAHSLNALDQVARIAAAAFRTPVALVTFLDDAHIVVAASVGLLNVSHIAHDLAPCVQTTLSEDIYTVTGDFSALPRSDAATPLGFYVGAPVRTRDRRNIGAVCLFDESPRELSLQEKSMLHALADMVADQLELRRLVEKLLHAETRFQSLVHNSSDILAILDADGRLRYASESIHRVTGCAPESLTGRQALDFVHPDDLEDVSVAFASVLEQADFPIVTEHRLRCADGSWIWLESIGANLLQNPTIAGVVVNARDISERKQSEAALRASEERYRDLFENASDYIYTHDFYGVILSANIATERLTGYSRREMRGMNVLSFIVPEHHELAMTLARRLKFDREPQVNLEVDIVNRSGERISLEVSSRPVVENGRARAMQTIARDITQRKKLEREQAAAREAAIEAAQMKSQFLANMSHEIRTPMNGVIGMTDLLLETDLAPEQREYAMIIRSSGEALLNIINDILDVSKIEAGKLTLEAVDFDVRQVVEETVAIFAQRAQAKGLELACLVYRDAPRRLRGDPGRLRQILTNLIGNAIKFTEYGEVIVRVKPDASVSASDAVSIRFEVSDTGIGIAPSALSRLFLPFSQADNSMSRKYGGTGLGLVICKQLAELMGGDIAVESELGRGSTFWFTVRFAQSNETPSALVAPLRGARALIIADNPVSRDVLTGQIGDWAGAAVQTAEPGRALDVLRTAAAHGAPVTVVVIDIASSSEGLAFTRRLTSVTEFAPPPVVLLSSSRQAEDERAKRSGAFRILKKPVRQSHLVETLRAALAPDGDAENAEARSVPLVAPLVAAPRTAARILLAEDNPVNQQVALHQLRKLGFEADLAETGEVAVRLFSQSAYDLILMDCQMPEMDGFTATAEIRRLEGDGRRTPVIAMTANAMAGERERCLQAGMDDYIAKPAKLETLHETLTRWLESDRPAPVDERVFSRLKTFESDDEPNFLAQVAEIFISDTHARLQELHRAVESRDLAAVGRLGHYFKGSSANIGAHRMTDISAQIEASARAGDPDTPSRLYEPLTREFFHVKRWLESVLRAPSAHRR
jgi:PAS domain S-box-containing protein